MTGNIQSYEQANTTDKRNGIPISCSFHEDSKLFRVNFSQGKTLSSGGFGFVSPNPSAGEHELISDQHLRKKLKEDNETDEVCDDECRRQITSPHHFLFIEEVLFLHERGLLASYSSKCPARTSNRELSLQGQNSWRKQEAWELYELLPKCNLSFAAYLVYAYLRNQSFRVVRHTAFRYSILQKMDSSIKERNEGKVNQGKILAELRRILRQDDATAVSPTMHGDNDNSSTAVSILYDVYQPNDQFSRSKAGSPDFYVAATYFNSESALNFCDIQRLLAQRNGISLCIAAVSDSGVVVMYGVTDVIIHALT